MLFRTTLIAAATAAMAGPAYPQQSSPQRGVRIITPYSEHIYSADRPQQLPDDEGIAATKRGRLAAISNGHGEATTRGNGRRLEGIGAINWPHRRQRGLAGQPQHRSHTHPELPSNASDPSPLPGPRRSPPPCLRRYLQAAAGPTGYHRPWPGSDRP
jgi:hypothetical protein